MEAQSPSIMNLTKALVAAQIEFCPALKTAFNPHFESNYVDLAGAIDACREALHKNGLAVVQTTLEGEKTILRTLLAHTSGEWIAGEYPIKPVKPDPQSMGAAMTYARRYTFMAIVGIAPEDDDGEQASGRKHDAPAKQPEKAWDSRLPENEFRPPAQLYGLPGVTKEFTAACVKRLSDWVTETNNWWKDECERTGLGQGVALVGKAGAIDWMVNAAVEHGDMPDSTPQLIPAEQRGAVLAGLAKKTNDQIWKTLDGYHKSRHEFLTAPQPAGA